MSRLTDQLNLNDVHRVVQQFYLKARQHPVISHYFAGIEDFHLHEEKITAFWWIALGGKITDLPGAAPAFDMINKHLALGILEADLGIWLSLFEQTLFENIEESLASEWLTKVHEIARHLKALVIDGEAMGLQIRESQKS